MTYDEELFDGAGCVQRRGHAAAAKPGAASRFGRGYLWSLVLGFVFFPAPVFALLMTLSLESIPGSVPLIGDGTNNATLNFGNVSAFEPLPAGVTRTPGASNYTVSSRFGVRATNLLGLLSSGYTLRARLRSAQPLTWKVDGVTMSTSLATIAPSLPYGAIVPHTLAVVVPFSHPAGGVTMVLEVTAIAN